MDTHAHSGWEGGTKALLNPEQFLAPSFLMRRSSRHHLLYPHPSSSLPHKKPSTQDTSSAAGSPQHIPEHTDLDS